MARSILFFVVYLLYLAIALGLPQRLVVWPLVTLFPARRRAVVGAWLRLHARGTLALARVLANVKVTIRGPIAKGPCVVVMNHQSVLDIPLGVLVVSGPFPLIVTRARYRRGLPGISPLTRLMRCPFVSQGRSTSRAEVVRLAEAAQEVARGEQSLLIYPEGHRTPDGQILPFMTPGLRLILARARRPVYAAVVDGVWSAGTFGEAALRIAGSRAEVVVLGPFTPAPGEDLDAFIGSLRERMAANLAERRAAAAPPSERATARPVPA